MACFNFDETITVETETVDITPIVEIRNPDPAKKPKMSVTAENVLDTSSQLKQSTIEAKKEVLVNKSHAGNITARQ